MKPTRNIAKVYTKVGLRNQRSDFAYWQTQSYQARLAALEQIRKDTIFGNTMLNQDFKEFVELLNQNSARYLVVGGYAVALHGHPRYTKDNNIS